MLLLDEVVRWRRWTATAVGFLGVVVMVRPGAGVFDPYALVALLAGFFVACVTVALKRLSATESAETASQAEEVRGALCIAGAATSEGGTGGVESLG